MPDSALEKVTVAITAITKLIKSLGLSITSMKPHLQHHLVKSGYDKSSSHLSKLKAFVSTMETIKLLGTMDDGQEADCRKVLKLLGEAASCMDSAFTDMQANIGFVSGLKRGS